MSRDDNYNYFDLDNFDDSRNEYRRRHPQNKNTSYSDNRRPPSSARRKPPHNSRSVYASGRSAYSTSRNRRNKRKNYRRTRNRIIIVNFTLAIIIIIITLITIMIKGCSGDNNKDLNSISSETKSTATTTVPSSNQGQNTNSATPEISELSPQYFVTPKIEDDNTNGINAYGVYVWHNTGFEQFSGTDEKAQIYANAINSYADKFADGVTVYDMVIPNHTEVGLPQRLKDGEAYSTSQADSIKKAYENLSDKVIPINAYNYLAEHNNEYIYFKSDHHWTGLGAYYAYTAFAQTTNQNVLSLDDCTPNTIEGFTGSFANYSETIDSDTVTYWSLPYSVSMDIIFSDGTSDTYNSPYYEYASAGSNTYGVFILGDNQDSGLTILRSSSENASEGKKIAVVKESYGNAIVPFLTNNYQEVHVIDFRYFNKNLASYCAENGINEVLFINGIMSANTQIQIDSMSSLFK